VQLGHGQARDPEGVADGGGHAGRPAHANVAIEQVWGVPGQHLRGEPCRLLADQVHEPGAGAGGDVFQLGAEQEGGVDSGAAEQQQVPPGCQWDRLEQRRIGVIPTPAAISRTSWQVCRCAVIALY
jgi:hypothetical protein